MNLLNPKHLILSTIKEKLESDGIHVDRILFTFNMNPETYEVLFFKEDHQKTFELQEKEMSTLKTLFINKILRKIKREKLPTPDKLIIDINLESEDFDIFQEIENVITLVNF